MKLDEKNKKSIGIDKFQIESKLLGIHLSSDDIDTILSLFEIKENYNNLRNLPEINYEHTLKHIVPILSRNSDKAANNTNSCLRFNN